MCKSARAGAFNVAGILLAIVSAYDDPESDERPSLRTGASLESFLKGEEPVGHDLMERMDSISDKLSKLLDADPEIDAAGNIGPKSVFSSKTSYFKATTNNVPSFAPVDFISSAMLVYKNPDRPNALLLQDIKALRKFVRQKHKDLRMNQVVFKTAWEFIVDEMSKRLAGDYSGDIGDEAPAEVAAPVPPVAEAEGNGNQVQDNEVVPNDVEQEIEQHAEPGGELGNQEDEKLSAFNIPRRAEEEAPPREER